MSDFTQLAFHTPIKAYKHINHLWTTDGLCCIRPLWRYTISLLWNGHSLFCSDHQPSWHNACWTSRWRLTASWSSLTWPWKLTGRSTGCSSLCHPTLSPISNAPGAANGLYPLEAGGGRCTARRLLSPSLCQRLQLIAKTTPSRKAINLGKAELEILNSLQSTSAPTNCLGTHANRRNMQCKDIWLMAASCWKPATLQVLKCPGPLQSQKTQRRY